MIYVHLLTLNYPLKYAKRFIYSNSKGKQQLYTHLLYESLVGQCECTTQAKGSFWCHIIDTKGAVLLVILFNKFVLVLFHSHLGMWWR